MENSLNKIINSNSKLIYSQSNQKSTKNVIDNLSVNLVKLKDTYIPEKKILSNSKKLTLDGGLKCWLIVFSCAFINAILFGIYRSYSLLYSDLINKYKLNRTEASWPFSLCMTTIHLTGPFSALLNIKFSTRLIYFFGCILSILGIGLCCFATSIIQISVYIGIIQGLGIGLIYVQSVSILSQYFFKKLGIATGITMSGGTFGAFLIAPLLEYTLKNYELNYSFIMLTFFTILNIPCTIILKNNKSSVNLNKNKLTKNNNLFRKNVYNCLNKFSNKTFINCNIFKLKEATFINSNYINALPKNFKNSNSIHHQFNYPKELNLCQIFTISSSFNSNSSFTKKNINSNTNISNNFKIKSNLKKKIFLIAKSILTNSYFWLIMSTHLAYFWSIITYSMIIVDYSIDCGIEKYLAYNMITSFSIGDFLGRIGLGWIIDKKFLSNKNFYILNILLIGILLNTAKYIFSYYYLLTLTFIIGIFSGSIVVLVNLCFCQYLGKKKASLGFGFSSFFCGLFTLNRPDIIGYYRDVKGSYSGLFHLLSLLCFITTFLWVVEFIINTLKTKNKFKNKY